MNKVEEFFISLGILLIVPGIPFFVIYCIYTVNSERNRMEKYEEAVVLACNPPKVDGKKMTEISKKLKEWQNNQSLQKPQEQCSLQEQLRMLISVANREGLYDAADFLQQFAYPITKE